MNTEFPIDIKNKNFESFIKLKVEYFQSLLNKTVISINQNIKDYILTPSEHSSCMNYIDNLYDDIYEIAHIENPDEIVIEKLQNCNDKIFNIFKDYGTQHISDILNICFGKKYVAQHIDTLDSIKQSKYQLLNTYSRPIYFKIVSWKNGKIPLTPNKTKTFFDETSMCENSDNLQSFDMARTSKDFISRVNGIKTTFHNSEKKKSVIISSICENVLLKCIQNEYIKHQMKLINDNIPADEIFNHISFVLFNNGLSFKQLCVYSHDEIYNMFVGYVNQCELIKQKPIYQVVKEFTNSELYNQRLTIIQLLLKNHDPEYCHIAYLLYDLLTVEDKGRYDMSHQTALYDSLPWNIRKCFKKAMSTTINYTKSLINSDNNKIPMEQQICLMKVSDSVKEKAMKKLNEVKTKNDDSGSKARQYLDGLLKIPFGIYKQEPILNVIKTCSKDFNTVLTLHEKLNISNRDNYTTLELQNYLSKVNIHIQNELLPKINKDFSSHILSLKRNQLVDTTIKTNNFIKQTSITYKKLIHSAKKNDFLINSLKDFFNNLYTNNTNEITQDYLSYIKHTNNIGVFKLIKDIENIENKWSEVQNNMINVREVLDNAVYGHTEAKRQIERIIGQWMSGEQKGYCFGFEGPPGIGKTSLAKKGLAKCLVDEDGVSRPFGFIAIGGSANGSTLEGHNYTYVGSSWGRIVDILMDSKCLNPIIFIDELDKISNTEHGKELIGILTHLVDQSQNDEFNDKYFSGINIDLSKALFIFSYNDVSRIDRILLDRIHRIKFKHLSIEEKIVVVHKHIFPEIFKKFNLVDMIHMNDDVIRFIIENYTLESGVRKLKEILFEIISEINLEILNYNKETIDLIIPIELTMDQIHDKYLKERNKVSDKKIHIHHEIGIINGLWANALGQGGIIPIQSNYFPTNTFLDLKLTGMQGDVMKESMNVAKTLAYKLTDNTHKKHLLKVFKDTRMQGLHIHCPEGAVPKDGPSAGTAITTTLYSLLNDKQIKNYVAITGEINLQGYVTAIGGLDLKILGGIKAGVQEFIFPKENNEDFQKFMDKYADNPVIKGILFHQVEHIEEVFELVFV